MNLIDLVSDTVTRPTPAMLEAMASAQVGDDTFGEDPSVNALQDKAAGMFGVEAALFCASGTMTNQAAIMVHCRPGDEIICHRLAHIYSSEGGGIMTNSGASVKLLGSDDGLMDAAEVAAAIGPENLHKPRTRMVAIENTSNMGGGTCYDWSVLEEIGRIARDAGLAYHLDGARLFNAIVAKGSSPREFGALFDSISICLSKGLGCPVGSLLLGSAEFIREARRARKRLGGAWRQAGFLAAAGIHALDHHVDRLTEDHENARKLADCLAGLPYVEAIQPVETNIVVFRLADQAAGEALVNFLADAGIRIYHGGRGFMRMVAHLDVSMGDIDTACGQLEAASAALG
jgi:threonine aldolase